MKYRYRSMIPAMLTINLLGRIGLRNVLSNQIHTQVNAQKTKIRAFAGYTPTEHDVFICTYAKSGTNWMMQIVSQLARLGQPTEFDHIHDLVPWPEAPMPTIRAKLNDPNTYRSTPTKRRGIKTHLEADYVPYNSAAKYLVVFRDPKDVFVSSYFFGTGILGVTTATFTVADWLKRFFAGNFLFGSWAEHMASYWALRDKPNIKFIQFATLKQQPTATIAEIASFLDLPLTPDQLANVVRQSDFAYMKSIHDKFEPPFPSLGTLFSPPPMLRAGKAGASDSVLTRTQQAQIDAFCQTELQKLGSDFPYPDYFDVVTEAAI